MKKKLFLKRLVQVILKKKKNKNLKAHQIMLWLKKVLNNLKRTIKE